MESAAGKGHQEITEVRNINPGERYALRSRACGCYLDGRSAPGDFAIMSKPGVGNNLHLQWTISYCDPGYYYIKSVSNGGYLDGRHAEDEILVTNRKPLGDNYLNWKIGECDGHLTF